ncbi:MAG: hypothetical protein AAF725_16845 [Acidobacteriota bacterium]
MSRIKARNSLDRAASARAAAPAIDFRPALLAALLVFGLAASPASAEKTRIDRWRAEIAKIDERQQAGKTERAQRQARKLWREMRERGWREPKLPALLAEVAAQLAIAEINSGGDRRLAHWTWHTALLLDSEAAQDRDWSRYGKAGNILLELPLRSAGVAPAGSRALAPPFPSGGRLERPRPRDEFDQPVLPLNRAARHERRITRPGLEVIIHADGSVSQPVIVYGQHAKPTVLITVLELVFGSAPYVPGKLDGEAVDVIYKIDIEKFNFRRWEEMVVYQ